MFTLTTQQKQQLLLNAVFLFGDSIKPKTTFIVVNSENTIEEWCNEQYPDPLKYEYFNFDHWTVLCDRFEFDLAVKQNTQQTLNLISHASGDFFLKDHIF